MTAPSEPKAPRHLQGDGQPFGIASVAPRATIQHRELNPIIDPLDLADDVSSRLKRQLRDTLSAYLGSGILAEKKVAHARALELLEMLSGNAKKLHQYINELDNDILVQIDEQRVALRGAEQVRHFSFLHFAPAIFTLGEAAAMVSDELKPRWRGGQHKTRLDTAIGAMLAALGECGLDVSTTDSGSRVVDRRRMGGLGGDLLKSLFAHFDPHVTEAQLVGAVERVRKAMNAAP